MKKIYLQTLFVIILSFTGINFKLNAQTWMVGVPVNNTLTSFGYAALGGCSGSADVTWTFSLPAVSGISYALVVTSADSNSIIVNPGTVTIKIGDTIPLASGTSIMVEAFYFSSTSATMPLLFNLVAYGTPTVSGEAYPCSLPNPYLFLSNMGICPDGLSAGTGFPANCTTTINTAINQNILEGIEILYPKKENGYYLKIKNSVGLNSISIFDISGKNIITSLGSRVENIDCSQLSPGIYFLRLLATDGPVVSNRFSISK